MGNPEVTRTVFLRPRTAQSGPVLNDFEIRELALPALDEGGLLIRNAYRSVDPSVAPVQPASSSSGWRPTAATCTSTTSAVST